MEMAGGDFADPEPGKPLRALNRDLETYVWKEEQGQLYRVSPGAGPVNGELLVFPPGSCKVLSLSPARLELMCLIFNR